MPLSECQMECEPSQVEGSRTAGENSKVVLPISFIKADAKAHLSNADSRIPLQSEITRILIFTVKNEMQVKNYRMESRYRICGYQSSTRITTH